MFKKVQFSEEGSNDRVKEEGAYMMFLEYLDECEKGILYLKLTILDYMDFGRLPRMCIMHCIQ